MLWQGASEVARTKGVVAESIKEGVMHQTKAQVMAQIALKAQRHHACQTRQANHRGSATRGETDFFYFASKTYTAADLDI